MPGSPTIERIGMEESPEMLLARLAEFDGGIAAPSLLSESPATAGDFSLPDIFPGLELETLLHSATGEPLPRVETQLVGRAEIIQSATPLGELAAKTVVSTTTACWSIIKNRDHKGYVRVYNPAAYGLNLEGDHRYGIKAHRLAYLLNQQQQGLEATLTPGTQVDHICRNTACCNPNHLAAVSNAENNALKVKAHKVESALSVGQIVMGETGIKWLDYLVQGSLEEDTNLIISTSTGPYRIIKLDDSIFYGQREACEVFDALRPLAVNTSIRKSRAKKTVPLKNQSSLFVHNRYKKADVPTAKALYQIAEKGLN